MILFGKKKTTPQDNFPIGGLSNTSAISKKDIAIIENIDACDPNEFVNFICRMFRKLGYNTKNIDGFSDNGIDIYIEKDGIVIAVQVKRYSIYKLNELEGVLKIQGFRGSMAKENITRGIYLTTHYFSPKAIEFVENENIQLINRDLLFELINKAYPDIFSNIMYKQSLSQLTQNCKKCDEKLIKCFSTSKKKPYYYCPNGCNWK